MTLGGEDSPRPAERMVSSHILATSSCRLSQSGSLPPPPSPPSPCSCSSSFSSSFPPPDVAPLPASYYYPTCRGLPTCSSSTSSPAVKRRQNALAMAVAGRKHRQHRIVAMAQAKGETQGLTMTEQYARVSAQSHAHAHTFSLFLPRTTVSSMQQFPL